MNKTIITITLALLLALAGAVGADQTKQSRCAGLQAATEAARARWMAEDLAMREQTVMLPPASVSVLSCLDQFTASVDVTKYDPAAVASMLARQAKQRT